MPLIHLLLAAASLSALAGGAWSVERIMDRYARIPDRCAEASAGPCREAEAAEDDDPRLIH